MLNIPKRLPLLTVFVVLLGCENPEGISDDFYSEYKQLSSPKLLYSCKATVRTLKVAVKECVQEAVDGHPEPGEDIDEYQKKMKEQLRRCGDGEDIYDYNDVEDVAYSASQSALSNFNKLLVDAKDECEGEFKILESEP